MTAELMHLPTIPEFAAPLRWGWYRKELISKSEKYVFVFNVTLPFKIIAQVEPAEPAESLRKNAVPVGQYEIFYWRPIDPGSLI